MTSVPCPSCRTPIRVEDESDSVTMTDARSLFGRSKFPDHQPNQTLDADSEPVVDARFRDVTKVAVDRDALSENTDLKRQKVPTVIAPPEPQPPVPETRRARPLEDAELKQRLRAKLKAPQPAEPAPIEPVEDLDIDALWEESEPLSEPEPEIRETPDPEKPAKPIKGPTTPTSFPKPPEPPPLRFSVEELEQGLNVRVEGVSYGTLEPSRLEQIVSSGVWTGAIEVETTRGWMTLDRHPALALLKDRLAKKAQVALAQISQEVDRSSLDLPTSEPLEVPASETAQIQSTPGVNRWAVVSTVLLVVCAVGAYAWINRPTPADPEAEAIVVQPPPEAKEFAQHISSTALGLANASALLRNRDPSELISEAEASLARANFGDALDALFELRRRDPKQKAILFMLIKAQLGARRYRDARATVITLAAIEPDHPSLATLYRDSVQQDDTLGWTVLEVGVDVPIDQIKALGGGKSVSFKFKRDGRNVFAFKPSQLEWEEGWRGEIAAHRFCELANCGFSVPRSRPAKVSRATLEKLYPMNTEWQKGYADRFEEIVWTTETVDEKSVEFAYGVMKDWLPHFADWPIEYTDIWVEWLNPTVERTDIYDAQLKDAMSVVAERNPQSWRKLSREFADASVRQAAAEISNLLVFDYLINNWDRFSDKEEYYGVNNQFADGHFISLDNGAGFGLRHSTRVEDRFDLVGRFSREMIASIKMIDATYQGFLMPDPSTSEKKRMALFWERREQVLTRVKQKKGEHDEKLVMAFD